MVVYLNSEAMTSAFVGLKFTGDICCGSLRQTAELIA